MATTKKPAVKKTATKKTTTAKTAAKKTTIAKKTTATKTTTKKTTTTKPTAKTATKSAVEISVTGNKKVGTLMKEFNKKFPYLRLCISDITAQEAQTKGVLLYNLAENKTLASVRRVNSSGDISISGNKKVKSLEKEFEKVFGLYAQVCFTSAEGIRYYTLGSYDDKTLASLNEECEKDGCKKGVWK